MLIKTILSSLRTTTNTGTNMEDWNALFYSLIIKGMLSALIVVGIIALIKRKRK
jgi:hypothetical protein